jgi:hypothetical protein
MSPYITPYKNGKVTIVNNPGLTSLYLGVPIYLFLNLEFFILKNTISINDKLKWHSDTICDETSWCFQIVFFNFMNLTDCYILLSFRKFL